LPHADSGREYDRRGASEDARPAWRDRRAQRTQSSTQAAAQAAAAPGRGAAHPAAAPARRWRRAAAAPAATSWRPRAPGAAATSQPPGAPAAPRRPPRTPRTTSGPAADGRRAAATTSYWHCLLVAEPIGSAADGTASYWRWCAPAPDAADHRRWCATGTGNTAPRASAARAGCHAAAAGASSSATRPRCPEGGA
jgi:hypothetical protein